MSSISAENNNLIKNFQKLVHKLFPIFYIDYEVRATAQKIKFSIKDFFSKSDQIRSFQRIWSHLLKKSLMENFIFYAMFA